MDNIIWLTIKTGKNKPPLYDNKVANRNHNPNIIPNTNPNSNTK